jgi:hypothetical protein
LSESNTQRLRVLKQTEASAIAAAATQIELALREAHEPVEDLGLLIGQIAATLGQMRTARRSSAGASAPPVTGSAPEAVGEVDAAIERLEAALHGSIERLQFYDSMVQHLSHVRDYLASVANQLAHGAEAHAHSPELRGPADAAAWEKLRHQLRRKLITDAQRELLDLVLPVGAEPGAAPAARPTQPERVATDNIELF